MFIHHLYWYSNYAICDFKIIAVWTIYIWSTLRLPKLVRIQAIAKWVMLLCIWRIQRWCLNGLNVCDIWASSQNMWSYFGLYSKFTSFLNVFRKFYSLKQIFQKKKLLLNPLYAHCLTSQSAEWKCSNDLTSHTNLWYDLLNYWNNFILHFVMLDKSTTTTFQSPAPTWYIL